MAFRAGEAGVNRRRCVICGHDGRALQGERGRLIFMCPSCDADLYARPPMSYAEMEGLLPRRGMPRRGRRVLTGWLRGVWRLVQRGPVLVGRAVPDGRAGPRGGVGVDASRPDMVG